MTKSIRMILEVYLGHFLLRFISSWCPCLSDEALFYSKSYLRRHALLLACKSHVKAVAACVSTGGCRAVAHQHWRRRCSAPNRLYSSARRKDNNSATAGLEAAIRHGDKVHLIYAPVELAGLARWPGWQAKRAG